VRAWIFGICAGLARNYRRRAFRRLETLSGGPLDTPAGDDPEQVLDAHRKRRRAERALETLGPEQRAVFVLFEVEGMSGKAIAELLDVPLGTVHSRLHAARRALLEAIDAGGTT
jgi:RNA polymerase sigma-70 factor (ECF subfamily)